ncbi:type II toxin-antitoxin system RelE/ParE family toxin [Tardiphaga sp.]|jgi:putative addiction module killer protein|uniref:type II toxin-antitoxin system RelE/ParE family toxin n=1 Tax=Tardiphaga sp. TaxID=1926292 RepID=UPI0037DA4E1F
MFEVLKTSEYQKWITSLADLRAQALITARVDRLALGNPGNVKAVGDGVSELKIDFGPGYRVYFTRTGKTVVLLLCGGDKSSQAKDIRRAKQIAASL